MQYEPKWVDYMIKISTFPIEFKDPESHSIILKCPGNNSKLQMVPGLQWFDLKFYDDVK